MFDHCPGIWYNSKFVFVIQPNKEHTLYIVVTHLKTIHNVKPDISKSHVTVPNTRLYITISHIQVFELILVVKFLKFNVTGQVDNSCNDYFNDTMLSSLHVRYLLSTRLPYTTFLVTVCRGRSCICRSRILNWYCHIVNWSSSCD